MKSLFITLLIAIPTLVLGQKKINHKVYLYGNVKEKVKSTVLVRFSEADPKTDLKTVKYFKELGVKTISWNNLFIPGAEYSEEEFNKALQENNISTIVMIGVTSRSKSNYSFSNTNAYASAYSTQSSVSASGSSYTSGGNVNYTSGLSLKMDIFSIDNSFDKPVGVIMGEATGDWGVASSERSIAKKILRRMLDGLFWEKAFEE